MASKVQRAILEADRKGYDVDKKGNVISPYSGRKLKYYDSGGYFQFCISLEGERTTIKVHRFIGYKKFGTLIFKKGIHLRHLNSDSKDNSWNNISYGSQSENKMDKPASVRLRVARVAARKNRKLTYEEAEQLREDHRAGFSYKELREIYGITKSAISYIVNYKTYSCP